MQTARRVKNKPRATVPAGFRHIKSMGGMHEYELSANGLRVLYAPVPGSNTVTTNIVYLVGSRHEARGKTGLAHILEHMMFKPTHDGYGRRHDVPGHETLGRKGAIMNATTWTDRTNYYFQLPPAYLPLMLETEAIRMRNIIIDESEFLPERRNVLSEYEMGESDPLEVLDKLMTSQAFYAHGYGHSTIGFKPDIEACTHHDLIEFHDRYYWPNNAVLVIAGDVSLADALRETKKYFGRISRSPKPILPHTITEPEQEGERRVRVLRESPINMVGVGYRAPGVLSREWAVAQILLTYLTDEPSGPLYRALIESHKASKLAPMLFPSKDPYSFLIYAYVSKGVRHAKVEDIIKKEIESIKKTRIPKADLSRIKTKLISVEEYRRDGTLSVANVLTEYIAGGDWARYHTLIDDLKSVSEKDIQAYAAKYLSPKQVVVGEFCGTLAP